MSHPPPKGVREKPLKLPTHTYIFRLLNILIFLLHFSMHIWHSESIITRALYNDYDPPCEMELQWISKSCQFSNYCPKTKASRLLYILFRLECPKLNEQTPRLHSPPRKSTTIATPMLSQNLRLSGGQKSVLVPRHWNLVNSQLKNKHLLLGQPRRATKRRETRFLISRAIKISHPITHNKNFGMFDLPSKHHRLKVLPIQIFVPILVQRIFLELLERNVIPFVCKMLFSLRILVDHESLPHSSHEKVEDFAGSLLFRNQEMSFDIRWDGKRNAGACLNCKYDSCSSQWPSWVKSFDLGRQNDGTCVTITCGWTIGQWTAELVKDSHSRIPHQVSKRWESAVAASHEIHRGRIRKMTKL